MEVLRSRFTGFECRETPRVGVTVPDASPIRGIWQKLRLIYRCRNFSYFRPKFECG